MTSRTLARAATVLLALTLALLAVPSVAQAVDAVDPPRITSGPSRPVTLNPGRDEVRLTVAFDNPPRYTLWATWGSLAAQAVPAGQSFAFDFTGVPDGTHRIQVYWCDSGDPDGLCSYRLDPADHPDQFTPPITVDTAAPAATLTTAARTFYPAHDDYRDTLAVAPAADEPQLTRTLVLRNGAGTVVRTLMQPAASAVDPAISWDGRDDQDARVPAGSYTPELTVTDAAGNTSRTTGGPVTVSAKALHTHRYTRTLGAAASLVSSSGPSCAAVRRPGRATWRTSVGYDSCAAGPATGRHSVRLPASTVPGRLTLSVYGAADPARPSSAAVLTVLRSNGARGTTATLGSRQGHHGLPTQSASALLRSSAVSWLVSTSGGRRYDVASFAVSYTYQTLE